MQYVQRKLQRSVTEMRRSRNGRARRSSSGPSPMRVFAPGRGRLARCWASGMTVRAMDTEYYRGDMTQRPARRIAVVLERFPIESRWQTHDWRVCAVLPDAGETKRVLVDTPESLQVLHPGFDATLFEDEAEGHY